MTVKDALLKNAGVKLAKDGKSVFNYNPGKYSAGLNWAFALTVMPSLLTKASGIQLVFLLGCLHFWVWVVSNPSDVWADRMIPMCHAQMVGLTRFVLGLFVSLIIGKTYYANRGQFGVLFGRSMGLSQMVAAWVKAPDDNPEAATQACEARKLIVRWANASFRLMWLETGVLDTPEKIGKDMLSSGLMTEDEWNHVAGLSSRCTHIYQWMNNVLVQLLDAGYIRDTILLNRMHEQIDDMRAANVWGLPSVPIPYVTLITVMVKMNLLTHAFAAGAVVRAAIDGEATWLALLIPHLDLSLHSFLFQGLLDLHGLLYNPNQGLLLGHLPVVNFLAFVQSVTNALLSESCIQGVKLPYKLDLPPINGGITLREGANAATAQQEEKAALA